MDKKKKATAPTLSSRQKQYLKGLAHELNPLVHIGKEGITDGIVSTINVELDNHELIKVKIGNNSGLEKDETASHIAAETGSALVQLIGKIVVLYKPNKDKKKEKRIILPKG